MQFNDVTQALLDASQFSLVYLKDHEIPRYFIVAAILIVVFFLLKSLRANAQSDSTDLFTHKDIEKIAGEDIISTQLDLAKAYIEMGQQNLAKPILKKVIKQTTGKKRYDVRQMLKSL